MWAVTPSLSQLSEALGACTSPASEGIAAFEDQEKQLQEQRETRMALKLLEHASRQVRPTSKRARTLQHDPQDQPSEAHKPGSSLTHGRAAASEEQQQQEQELCGEVSLALVACSPLTSSSTGFMSNGRLVTSGFDVIPIKQQPKYYS
jgi:hypothetical protein